MSTKIQLAGGAFQDVIGNPLANGYLLMSLSQDVQVNSDAQIAAGYEITITLNNSGSVDTTTPQYVWPNDVMLPINTFYNVSAYSADGQLVWGPNAQAVLSTPSPFDIGTWIPGIVNTSSNSADLLLQTNGVNNGNQGKLNLTQGTGITLVDDGHGDVSITSTATPITLQTNGTNNTVQSKLNLVAGAGITLASDGSGDVSMTSTGGTVDSVSVASANGVSGTSSGGANPALTIALGAITPSSVSIDGSQTINGVQGTTGTKIAATSGAFTNGNLRASDVNGNEVDSGVAVSNVPKLNSINTFTEALSAETFSSSTAVTLTAGMAVAPGCKCDAFSGTLTYTEGISGGTAFFGGTITFATPRASVPNVLLYWNNPSNYQFGVTASTTGIEISGSASGTATTILLTYLCAGGD